MKDTTYIYFTEYQKLNQSSLRTKQFFPHTALFPPHSNAHSSRAIFAFLSSSRFFFCSSLCLFFSFSALPGSWEGSPNKAGPWKELAYFKYQFLHHDLPLWLSCPSLPGLSSW